MQKDTGTNEVNLRLDKVLADYLQRVDRGESVSVEELVQSHPEYSDQLRSYFDNEKVFAYHPVAETEVFDNQSTPQNALRVRCPNCHSDVVLATECAWETVICTECESSFSLVLPSKISPADGCQRIGRFELEERVGVGGFGVVWKARDPELDRTVAIKIPRRSKLDSVEIEKFLREARAAAQLRHANIVNVHEVGRDGDSIFIISDFVTGVDLSEWLEATPPNCREAAVLIAKICRALHYAHEQGVIHRDIKPGNIMVDTDGEPHLMDFGLARREIGEVTVTMDGQVVGTPAYMAPEQAKGDSHKADRRSDVYSIGAILFELLTGERPFRGNARMLLQQVLLDDPPSPRKLNGNVPRDLETITLKCLEKDRNKRYESANDISDELYRYLRGEPIRARAIGTTGRGIRWIVRNKVLSFSMAAVLLVFLAGTIVSTWQWQRAERETARVSSGLYASRIAAVHQAWNDGDTRRMLQILEEVADDKSNTSDTSPWEIAYLRSLANSHLCTFDGHDAVVRTLDCSPDGGRFASGSEDATVRIWNALSGECVSVLTGHAEVVNRVRFHPKGNVVASCGRDGKVFVWDLKTSDQVHIWEGPTSVRALDFNSADGSLAFGNDEGHLFLWNIEQKNPKQIGIGHEGPIRNVSFDPSGRWLATAGFDKTVRILDLRSGAVKHVLSGHRDIVEDVAFSPSGDMVSSCGWDEYTRIWKTETGELIQEFYNGGGPTFEVQFSSSGRTIATGSDDRKIRFWEVPTGRPLESMTGAGLYMTDIAFTPDGRSFVHGSWGNSFKLWPVSEPESFLLGGHSGRTMTFAFSRDGSHIACGCDDSKVRVYDTLDGSLKSSHQGSSESITAIALNDTGSIVSAGNAEGTAYCWNVLDNHPLCTIGSRTENEITATALTPNGRQIAIGDAGGHISVWETTGTLIVKYPKQAGIVSSLAFSPCGMKLAVGVDDGNRVVRVWDTLRPTLVQQLSGAPPEISCVAYNPNGTLVAAGGMGDAAVCVWSTVTGQRQHVLRGHYHFVETVAFSDDSRRLATSGTDNTLKVWDTETGYQLLSLEGHAHAIRSIAFNSSERRLIAIEQEMERKDYYISGRRSTLRVWSVSPASETERLARHLVEGLRSEHDNPESLQEHIRAQTTWPEDIREAGMAYVRHLLDSYSTSQQRQ